MRTAALLVCVVGLTACATAQDGPVASTTPVEIPRQYIVFFNYDSIELSPEATEVIEHAATGAGTLTAVRLELAGYTGTEIDARTNADLAEQRFVVVEEALMARGVDRNRMSRASLADEIPLPAVAVRRIEIRFMEPAAP